jgi:hypothetical protein
MNVRRRLLELVAVVALSTGIGFTIAQASQPDTATARKGGEVVRELKKINNELQTTNSELDSLQNQIGTSEFDTGSIFQTLGDISRYTEQTCRAVKDSFTC